MKARFGTESRTNRRLYKLLRRFVYCVKQYDDPKNKDVAYWYGERSLTGLFSAASWLTPRGWGLEEFTSQRTKGKRSKPGRGDMWVGIGKHNFTIEAKVTWPEQYDDISKWQNRVNTKLGKAFDQLSKLEKDYQYGRPAAVCFVVPSLPKPITQETSSTLSKAFKRFVRMMTEDDPKTVAVACWNDGNRKAPSAKEPDGRTIYFYPGVVAIIRYQNTWRLAQYQK